MLPSSGHASHPASRYWEETLSVCFPSLPLWPDARRKKTPEGAQATGGLSCSGQVPDLDSQYLWTFSHDGLKLQRVIPLE